MNLNYKKVLLVQSEIEACDTLHSWVVDNCPDFGEMITRVASTWVP